MVVVKALPSAHNPAKSVTAMLFITTIVTLLSQDPLMIFGVRPVRIFSSDWVRTCSIVGEVRSELDTLENKVSPIILVTRSIGVLSVNDAVI